MSTDTSVNPGFFSRIYKALGSSAEYAISLALLLVCLVVGVVIWLGGGDENESEPTQSASLAAALNAPVIDEAASVDQAALDAERAALDALQQQLRDSMQEVEARGREQAEVLEQERLAEEERALREAELQEQQRLAQERLAALQAELAERERRQAQMQAKVAAQPKEPVRTIAKIDWSTCRQPEYPRASQLAGEEGTVVLSLSIDANGVVTDGDVSESSGSRRLDRSTLIALKKCRFKAATQDGVAIASTGAFRFDWSLQ